MIDEGHDHDESRDAGEGHDHDESRDAGEGHDHDESRDAGEGHDHDESITRPAGPIDDTGPVETLDSLPDRPLTREEYWALTHADAVDDVAPLLDNPRDERLHALSFVLDDHHYYVAWNPAAEQWEQVVHLDTSPEDYWSIEVIEVYDDESGEPQLAPDIGDETVVADVQDYVWEYVEHTYDETDHLWYVPHSVEALDPGR